MPDDTNQEEKNVNSLENIGLIEAHNAYTFMNGIKDELYALSEKKSSRAAAFTMRIKYQFILGGLRGKKEFILWIIAKITHSAVGVTAHFNPIKRIAEKIEHVKFPLVSYRSIDREQPQANLKPYVIESQHKYKYMRYLKNRAGKFGFDISKITVMQKKGLVSIVLPVYNGEKYLSVSINSILRQTYKNFELIIVNDGSKDGSRDIIDSYAKLDSRITAVHQENQKLPRALSNGFKLAKGEFFTWTSDDNIMHEDFVEKLVKELESDKTAGMVFANIRLIDDMGMPLLTFPWYQRSPDDSTVYFPFSPLELNIVSNNYIGAAFMYRAVTYMIAGNYSEYKFTLEDYDYWQKINSFFKIKHVSFEDAVYDYRLHKKSLTAQSKELKITEKTKEHMNFELFRQDFYLSPMLWILDIKEEYLLDELNSILMKNGCKTINLSELVNRKFTDFFPSVVLTDDINCNCNLNIKKVFITPNFTKETLKNAEGGGFIMRVALNDKNNLEDNLIRTSCVVKGLKNAVGFIDAKIKNDFLYMLEGEMVNSGKLSIEQSVIICADNSAVELEKCILSLINQSINKDLYEILVISSNSGMEEVCERWDARYVYTPFEGLAHACNLGLWEARGKTVVYIDQNSVVDPFFLQNISASFEKNKDAAVIGGNVVYSSFEGLVDLTPLFTGGCKSGESQMLSDLLPISGAFMKENSSKNNDDLIILKDYKDYPVISAFAARTRLLKKVGGFRTIYDDSKREFLHKEDLIASLQLEKMNYLIGMNPAALVTKTLRARDISGSKIRQRVISRIMADYELQADLFIQEKYIFSDIERNIYRYEAKLNELIESDNLDEIFITKCYIEGFRLMEIRFWEDIYNRENPDEFLQTYTGGS